MRNNSTSQSGIFNPRVILAFALCSLGVFLAMLSFAANPDPLSGNAKALASGSPIVASHNDFNSGAVFVRAFSNPSSAPSTNPPVVHHIGACVPVPGDQCEAWNTVYAGPLNNDTPGDQLFSARIIGSSTDGKTVFVTGFTERAGSKDSVATLAYDAATGNQQWLQRYDGTTDLPECVSKALTVNSSALYVGGFCFARDPTTGIPTGFHPVVLAYDTHGALLWSSFFLAPEFASVYPNDITVSPDGLTVYVEAIAKVASPAPGGPTYEMLTAAYDSSGNLVWYRVVNEAKSGGTAVRVSPDSATVYATGETIDSNAHATGMYMRAYTAAGVLRWSNLLPVPLIGNPPTGLAVAPDGSRVFLAGNSQDSSGVWNYDTIAYDSSSGTIVWHQRSKDAGQNWTYSPIAMSPDGALVYVTGTTGTGIQSTTPTRFGFDTIAYDSATGALIWESTLDDALNTYLYPFPGLDVSPKTGEVYVSGPDWRAPGAFTGAATYDVATYSAAYNGQTGQQLWTSLASAGSTTFVGVAAAADGAGAIVTTYSTTPAQYAGAPNNPPLNWLTFAYHALAPPTPTSIVSRKVHGSAGTFDINLPLTGTRGVECRSGGATSDYTMVFTFPNPMVSCGVGNTGSVTSGPNPNQCTVNLTGVPNAQYLTVTLTGAVDSTGATGNVSGTMGVLVGDVNSTGLVDGNDVSAVQGQARQSANSTNFRLDVNATGLIDGNDVSLVQSKTRSSFPSPP